MSEKEYERRTIVNGFVRGRNPFVLRQERAVSVGVLVDITDREF